VPAPTLPLTGGCGCGAVRFEIMQPLGQAVYCHCTRCQRRTGAAAGASAWVAPGSFAITAGEEHLKAWCRATASTAWEPLPDDGLPRHDERMPPPG
jgi:hypothetical protein